MGLVTHFTYNMEHTLTIGLITHFEGHDTNSIHGWLLSTINHLFLNKKKTQKDQNTSIGL